MEIASIDLPINRPVTIVPIGDIQWAGGGRGNATALDLLQRTIASGMEEDAYFIGMGDYIDFLSPSNRQRLTGAALYDTAMDVIDNTAMALTEEVYEVALKPTRGRWLGLLEGHHFSQLKSGMTTDQKLCEMLGARFLGTSAFLRLNFKAAKLGPRSGGNPIMVWASHGCGGGGRISGPLNKLEGLAPYWDADLFLMGHCTKQVVGAINRIGASFHGGAARLVQKKLLFVGTGGFSKGYMEGARQGTVPRGGYVEQKLLNPAALGAPIIRINPKSGAEWAPEITAEV